MATAPPPPAPAPPPPDPPSNEPEPPVYPQTGESLDDPANPLHHLANR